MLENNPHLFAWETNDMPELQRLILTLEHLPYQETVAQLESRHGCGPNDYPIRALFWTMVAGIAFGHDSVIAHHAPAQRRRSNRQHRV